MKKLVLILLVVFCCASLALAAAVDTTASNSRAVLTSSGVEQVVAQADGVNGYVADVDSRGSQSVREYPKQIAVSSGITLNSGVALVTGECYVSNIIVSGPVNAAAGDYVLIYDNTSATGTPKFDLGVGTAKDTISITIPGGAKFSTGVFADASDSNQHITVCYDN